MRSLTIAVALLATLFCSISVAETDGKLVEVLLRDGSVLRGVIVEDTRVRLVIETESAGRIEIERHRVRAIEPVEDPTRAHRGQDPDYNTIFFTPTPETLDAGTGYFRNFLLFFLNGGVSVTDDLDLSFGTVFPVSSELLGLSVGAKYRLLSREEAPIGAAILAQGSVFEEARFGSFGGVVGIGDRERSANLAVFHNFDDDGGSGTVFLIGVDTTVSGRMKFLAEYGNSTEAIGDDDEDDFNGLFNVGFRWYGERISFSLTGVRPFEDTGDSFLFLPLTMFSLQF